MPVSLPSAAEAARVLAGLRLNAGHVDGSRGVLRTHLFGTARRSGARITARDVTLGG